MKKHFYSAGLLLIIVVLTALVGRPYLHSGFPYTHDGENHLARFANYKIALKEGQVPPRFAPNLMNHYGYPVFNYNYPLANILSVPFSFFKLSYELAFKVIALSAVALGITGVITWVRILGFSKAAQVFTAVVYVTSPYLLNIVAFRGNIGELIALTLFPWLLVTIEWLRTGQVNLTTRVPHLTPEFVATIIVYTAFFLAHNLAFIFGLPLIGMYAMLRLGWEKRSWLTYFAILIWVTGLTLWFWLPAIAETRFVVLGSGQLTNDFERHFPTLAQLFFDTFTFGFSYPGAVDSLNFWLGGSQWLLLIMGSYYAWQKNTFWRGVVVTCWLLVGFQLSVTAPIWHLVSVTRFIQFPWRLSLFLTVMLVPLSALTWQMTTPAWRFLLAGVLALQLLTLTRIQPVSYFHKTNHDYDAYAESTSTLNENLPLTFTYLNVGDWQPGPSLLEGQGKITVHYWTGSDRAYQLELEGRSLITEPTMNFPGWKTTYTQTGSGQPQTIPNSLNSEIIQGRIAYQLEAGTYEVRTRFTQWTWPRLVGNIISLIAWGSSLLYGGWQLLVYTKQRTVGLK